MNSAILFLNQKRTMFFLNQKSMYDSMDRKFHQLVPKKDYEWHEVYVKLEVIE